jgi:hypothetical protein
VLILIMRVPFTELAAGSNPLAQLVLHLAETIALASVAHLGSPFVSPSTADCGDWRRSIRIARPPKIRVY